MRKSLRVGDSESDSKGESKGDSKGDSKGESEGGTKLFFQGAHQGCPPGVLFKSATSALVSRFAHMQVPSLKEPSLSELGPKWSGLK